MIAGSETAFQTSIPFLGRYEEQRLLVAVVSYRRKLVTAGIGKAAYRGGA